MPRVDVHLSVAVGELAQPVGVELYRIAQEALTNAMRHAGNVTHVIIEVSGEAERVRLTVRDDGTTTVRRPTPGFGLHGMRERAEVLGGGTHRAGPIHPIWT